MQRVLNGNTQIASLEFPKGHVINICEYDFAAKKYLVDFGEELVNWLDEHVIEEISNCVYIQ